jgi:hypothetical protein
MSTVQIAGCSGAGKTTIAAVLARRGLPAIDADDDPLLARSVDAAGNVVEEPEEPEEPDFAWLSQHSWAWDPARLDELIRAAAPATLYVCGGADNELELADRFTRVFLLEIDEPTMLARIDAFGFPVAGHPARRDGVADYRCPVQVQHAAGEPGGVHGFLGRVLEAASGQANEGHAGVPGENASLQEAIGQLEVDIRDQAFQVKPTRDPGSPKPQPMWIGVGRKPPTQDVPDHSSPAGPGTTPRPHRGLVNRLIGGQVKPFALADMIDQRLLYWGQSPAGRLGDHTGTLINVAESGIVSEPQRHNDTRHRRSEAPGISAPQP